MHVPHPRPAHIRSVAVGIVAALALNLGEGTTAADASEEPASEIGSVSGSFVRTETFKPLAIELCEEECFFGRDAGHPVAEADVADDGSFTIAGVDLDSTPRVVAFYETYQYRSDGTTVPMFVRGYLAVVEDEIRLVTTFEEGDPWTLSEDLGELEVFVPEPDRPIPTVKAHFKPLYLRYIGNSVTITYRATKVQDGTTIRASIKGCEGKVVGRAREKDKSGRFTLTIPTRLDRIARKVPVRIVATKKNHTPSTFANTWGPLKSRPRSC